MLRAEAPLLGLIEDGLNQPVNLELLDPSAPYVRYARMFIVRVATSSSAARFFFGPLGPKARLAKKERVIAIYSDGTFDSIQQEVLIFDKVFYATLGETCFVVTQQGTFENEFGMIAAMRAVTKRTMTQITRNLRITNRVSFETAVDGDINMIRKVRSIAQRLENNPSYLAALTMPKLLKFLDERPYIRVDLLGERDGREFVFHPDPQRRWRILKLLDDDYLQSPLTELEYEANSKDQLT